MSAALRPAEKASHCQRPGPPHTTHPQTGRQKEKGQGLSEGGRGGRGTVRKEEGKAERSRLGEWLESRIGRRAGWEEPKRPIVGGGGRELCKRGRNLRSCLRPAASLLQRGVASSDPAYSLPIRGQRLEKNSAVEIFCGKQIYSYYFRRMSYSVDCSTWRV